MTWIAFGHRWLRTILVAGLALGTVVFSGLPANGQEDAPPLPEDKIVVDIDAPDDEVFRIGVPDLIGEATLHAANGGAVLQNDFRLMPGFRVIGPKSIRHDYASKGLDVDLGAWAILGANGVIKGQLFGNDAALSVELRFYQSSGGAVPALRRTYRGPATELRKWMHTFVNEVIGIVTGTYGPFGTEITFARKHGPGHKSVYVAAMDGYGVRKVSSGRGVSMLPTFGKGAIWYTRMSTQGTFITNTRLGGKRLLGGKGITMAPAICGERMYFSSSRSGNYEIYSSNLGGKDLRRLTRSRGIDLSPTCGPGGKLAFVSNRHGSPQVFTMKRNGTNVQRVTFRGSHNQTPVWCQDPKQPLIAFSGRDQNFDIFTVNVETQEYQRLTQGQGDNKDPAFSPDCRLIAFSSNRRGSPGVYLSGQDGLDQNQVIKGASETVRWAR
jgi:TolB protein